MSVKDKKIAKLVGKFEDCAYLIKQCGNESEKDILQKQAIEYLKEIYNESNQLKEIDKYEINPAILGFLKDIKNVEKNLDTYIIQDIITIDKLKSIFNMVESIQGEKLYHLINHHKNIKQNYKIEYADGTIEEKNEIKKGYFMERLAKFTGLIFSGLASENLFELFKSEGFTEDNMPFSLAEIEDITLIDKYIKSLENILKKQGFDLNTTTPAGKGDLELNLTDNYVAVLTSTNINTSWQKNSLWKQLCKQDKDKFFQLIYLLNGFTNEGYKKDNEISYNTPDGDNFTIKARKHGLKILQQFSFYNKDEDVQLNFEQKLNALPFLSLIGNEALINHKYEDKNGNKITIADFLKINPLILGSDTYWLYKGMRECRLSDNPEESFFKFILDYAEDFSNTLSKALPNIPFGDSDQSGFHAIAENLNRLLEKIPNIFSPDKIGRKWSEDELSKCHNITSNIEEFISKVNPQEANLATNRFSTSLLSLNPEIIEIQHKKIDISKYIKKETKIDVLQNIEYQNCLDIIEKNMRKEDRQKTFIIGLLNSIKDAPENLYRSTYYQELEVHDILIAMTSHEKQTKLAGIPKYSTAQLIYDSISQCNYNDKENWFKNLTEKLVVQFKNPNELTKDNLEQWLYQVKENTGKLISKEFTNIFRDVLNGDIVRVSDIIKYSTFQQKRSQLLNPNNSNSKNLNNVMCLNGLGLNHKNNDYDIYKIINKENIQEILSNLLNNHDIVLEKKSKFKI